jgi:hypothetical protein
MLFYIYYYIIKYRATFDSTLGQLSIQYTGSSALFNGCSLTVIFHTRWLTLRQLLILLPPIILREMNTTQQGNEGFLSILS